VTDGLAICLGVCPGGRSLDADNLCKVLFDVLTDIAWEDDDKVQSIVIEVYDGQKSPHIEVIIEPLDRFGQVYATESTSCSPGN
jgi:hypothetical protein